METKFGKDMQDVWSHKTSGTLKFLIVRPMNENKKISAKDQQEYQLAVDVFLHLVKYLHANLANVTRELSKANDGANPAAYKQLIHVIKYLLDTKNLILKTEPTGNSNKSWKIVCFSKSNCARDPVCRRSISGFTLHALGVPVSWRSNCRKVYDFLAQRWSILLYLRLLKK